MYQSFVRGTLTKKRQSQFSERRAAREKNLQHTMALRDLAAQQQQQTLAANEMVGSGPVIVGAGAQMANTTGKNSGNFFGLAKNQNAMLKNMQLNQPSVMKNSTGAVGGMLSKATVNQMPNGSVMQEDMATGGLSSQVLINAGKKSLSRITDTVPKTDAQASGNANESQQDQQSKAPVAAASNVESADAPPVIEGEGPKAE